MKKILSLLTAVTISSLLISPVLASSSKGQDDDNKKGRGEDIREMRQDLKDKIKDLKDDFKEDRKAFSKQFVRREVKLRGELTAMSTSASTTNMTIKVAAVSPAYNPRWAAASTTQAIYPAKDATVVVVVDAKTKIYRNFFGRGLKPAQMSMGDSLKIEGKLNTDGTITALQVKNDSLELNAHIYKGTVQSIDSNLNQLVMVLTGKKNMVTTTMTVRTSADTKFVALGSTTTAFASIKVGDTINARGLVNTRLNVMDANLLRIITAK